MNTLCVNKLFINITNCINIEYLNIDYFTVNYI